MTDKENLKKALEALKMIGTCPQQTTATEYAADVYADLTQPRMELVEVKVWAKVRMEDGVVIASGTNRDALEVNDPSRFTLLEFINSYQRPIPEPEEEEWEGNIQYNREHYYAYVRLPDKCHAMQGSRVKVRRVEG